MRDLRAKRLERSRNLMKQLVELLPLDQYKAENSQLNGFLGSLDAQMQLTASDGYPGNPGN